MWQKNYFPVYKVALETNAFVYSINIFIKSFAFSLPAEIACLLKSYLSVYSMLLSFLLLFFVLNLQC